MYKKISVFLASCFYIGYIPIMPGTFGTAFAAIVAYLLPQSWFYELTGYSSLWEVNIAGQIIFTSVILLISFFSVRISSQAEEILGHDNKRIVLDEFCGYMLSIAFLPKTWLLLVYAFALFRVFDIAKPYPVNKLEKLKSGWGIMADDLMAGLYTNLLLQVLIRVYPRFFILN